MITREDDLKLEFDFEAKIYEADDRELEKGSAREICKFHLKGYCNKGYSCPFRHVRPEKAVVCKHWLRALCKKGDDCEFLHEYDHKKMPECWFFAKYNECSNMECIFLHLRPEDKIKQCPWYNRGFCKHGPNCHYKHILKVACPDYLAGFCARGPNCKFAHPRWDVPKEDPLDPNALAYKKQRFGHGRAHSQHQQHQPFAPIPTFGGSDFSGNAVQNIPSAYDFSPHDAPMQMPPPSTTPAQYQQQQQQQNTPAPFMHHQQQSFQQQQQFPHQGMYQQQQQQGGTFGSFGQQQQRGMFGSKQQGGSRAYRPISEVLCFKCNQMGHYANACPNRGTGMPKPSPTGMH